MSSFVEFHLGFSEEKAKISQPIRGQGCHLVFPIGPKNTNLVEDVEILLPVHFCWILSREVKNVSANQRLGGHLVYLNSPKNTNLVEDIEILLPIEIRGLGGHFVFPIGPKNTNLVEDVEIPSIFVEFCSEKSNMSRPIGGRVAILFIWTARKTQT